MFKSTTSIFDGVDTYAAAVKAVYELALEEEDTDAVVIENLSPTKAKKPGPEKPSPELEVEQLNKYLIFALKKVVGILVPTVSEGQIKSTHTDAVIDFMVKAAGISLPKEGDGLILQNLQEIKDLLTNIMESQEEGKQHTTRTIKIDKINEAANAVNTAWKNLQVAVRLGDRQRVFEQVAAIKSDIEVKLNSMRFALKNGDAEGDGLAVSLQRLYRRRLEDTSGNLTFDVQSYISHVQKWYDFVSSVNRMGTALLVLHEQCRDVKPKTRLGWQQVRRKDSEDFMTAMKFYLLDDINVWASTKALAEAASVDKSKQFPQTFELHNGAGRPMYIKDVFIVPPGAENGVGYHVYGFQEDDTDYSTPVSRAFALEYQGNLWQIRANREIQHSSECLFFPRWEQLRDDDYVYPLVNSSRNAATYKIIPLKHEKECRVKLVWLSKDGKSVRKILEPIIMKPIKLSYPVFGDEQEADPTRFRQLIDSNSGEKFSCTVTNRTSDLVFVLDDAYSNDIYYYANTIWLPGESYPVGAWGGGIRACFRFAVYKVKEAPSDKKEAPSNKKGAPSDKKEAPSDKKEAPGDKQELRSRVKELFGQLPVTGRPGLRADGAELIKYIWLRVKVPGIGKNSISVAVLSANDKNKDIVNLKNPIDLSNLLDQFKGYTDERHLFEWESLKAEVTIGSGHAPAAYCNVSTN
ncbi:hypothetical protein FS837_003702 [Tulasnella sp. UAMH 9824]|nr:hypothetical protein FS837_003702 [Tulasnella sp. UAMH 9824]